jgi:UTP--glucose-1-phosphate uridylyltransferase
MQTSKKCFSFDPLRARLEADNAPTLLIRHMERAHAHLAEGATGLMDRSMIEPVETLPKLSDLDIYADCGRAALPQTLVIKLNGGLGTSMGLQQAKSLLEVREGLSFLDIVIRQIQHLRNAHQAAIPLLFMNSFATRSDTLDVLGRYPELEKGQAGLPFDFVQHRIPKLRANTLEPVSYPEDPTLEWCPPGHGDLYLCLQTTGLLAQLLDRGYRYAFISNVDNLGAALDMRILGWMAEKNHPFIMEATARTVMDRKGGHLAQKADDGLVLRESAQCPADEVEEFQDIARYRYFNTNNIWVDLRALKAKLESVQGVMPLPLMVNRKTVNPRDASSTPVIQLETAMGSAISIMEQAVALDVPRKRFAPVKTTEDLLVLRSDAYILTEHQHVVRDPRRQGPPPDIRLDSAYYKMVHDFERRFPHGAPSLLECDELRVEGDVTFGRDTIVKGRARITHTGPGNGCIADRAVLSGHMHVE